MKNKVINVGLIGRTNAGKSTLINSLVGEKISIENKKINTTLESIIGVLNISNTQIIFYDTPGSNLLNATKFVQKRIRSEIWEAINLVDLILFIIDSTKFNYNSIIRDIKKIHEVNKPIIVILNKIDLIKYNSTLPYIEKINKNKIVLDFFNISAKNHLGLNPLIKYFVSKAKIKKWKFLNNEISNKSDLFISNECTRNALLKYIHKEIPYNLLVKNLLFKKINKDNIKIKQLIEISNLRYKPIILGKKGETIKKIRETSQKEIESILNSKIHLYLKIVYKNEK